MNKTLAAYDDGSEFTVGDLLVSGVVGLAIAGAFVAAREIWHKRKTEKMIQTAADVLNS